MRRSLLIILVFLSAWIPLLQGQVAYTFGVKGGISVANQRYRITPIDFTLDTDPVPGPAASVFLETFRGSHFSFQLDLSYACKGSITTVQGVTVNHLEQDRINVIEGEPARSRFRYMSLSPVVRYRLGQGSLVPYILAGPRLDLLLNYSSDSDYPLEMQRVVVFGLSCGAGAEYSLQKMGLFGELQYQPDLSPVTNEDPLLIRNRMLSLMLGIRWMIPD
jgi:hypothetical protein